MKKRERVCVIIPAYNEEKVIGQVISKARKVFEKNSNHPIDIVVVNDGSKDNTSHVARKASVIVVDHLLNLGAGAATATGITYAQKHGYDVAATMDADGQHNPVDVVKGIEKLLSNQTDLLVGNRLINMRDMPMYKRLGNRFISFLTAVLFWTSITDSQSGLRIFSRKSIKNLEWRAKGYEFCSEMLWRAKQQQLVVDDFPIETIYTEYSRSKGQSGWNGVNLLKHLLKSRVTEMFE